MSEDKLCGEALALWGPLAQMGVAMEECAELIVAINQLLRGRVEHDAVAEEVADVEIMCKQLRLIVGNELVDTAKEKKLVRLRDRIAKNSC